MRNLVELFAEVGVDTRRLLAQVGLSEDEVYNPQPALRFEQFRRVMVGAREMTGDPALGLALGQQLTLTAHGLLGYAAISSADLGDALRVNPDMLFMGGGNPAQIPAVTRIFADSLRWLWRDDED